MMIFLLGSGPDPGLAFLSWFFTSALRVLNKKCSRVSKDAQLGHNGLSVRLYLNRFPFNDYKPNLA